MEFWKIALTNFLSIFSVVQICRHNNFDPLSVNDQYCPDCGKHISVDWYIVHCANCDTRRSGFHLFGKFLPNDRFCKKCGCEAFDLEIKKELGFLDYRYACYKINELDDMLTPQHFRESHGYAWVEEPSSSPMHTLETPKLLALNPSC